MAWLWFPQEERRKSKEGGAAWADLSDQLRQLEGTAPRWLQWQGQARKGTRQSTVAKNFPELMAEAQSPPCRVQNSTHLTQKVHVGSPPSDCWKSHMGVKEGTQVKAAGVGNLGTSKGFFTCYDWYVNRENKVEA